MSPFLDDDDDDKLDEHKKRKPRNRVSFSVQKVSNGYIIEIEAQNYVFTDLIGVNNFIADWFDNLECKSNVG